MKMGQIAALAAVLIAAPVATQAGEVIVTPSSASWYTLPGENSADASTVITTTAPRSGDGSLELRGDRTRYQMGVQYSPYTTNLGPLSNVLGLSFDWRIAGDSSNPYNPDYTPALRLLVQDGSQRSELIWEGAYNGTYTHTSRDTWYSSTFNDLFYQNQAGQGVTLNGGAQVNMTLRDWITNNYSSAAYVSGISVGDGSGASANYHAFVDNVRLSTTSDGLTTYNFEVSAAGTGAVAPEPATWTAMLMGFGALGLVARRRRGTSKASV